MDKLKSTSRFHKELSQEVLSRASDLRPHIMTSRTNDGGKFHWTFDVLPVDLIAEFGLRLPDDHHESKGK